MCVIFKLVLHSSPCLFKGVSELENLCQHDCRFKQMLIFRQIRFISDPKGDFTSALELDFDATAIFGNRRSVRYALVTQDGKVESTHAEPDRTGVDGMASSTKFSKTTS